MAMCLSAIKIPYPWNKALMGEFFTQKINYIDWTPQIKRRQEINKNN